MTRADSTTTYTLTIRPDPAGRDHLNREPIHRLRAFLKSMLRRHGYRCIRITPDPLNEPTTAKHNPPPSAKPP